MNKTRCTKARLGPAGDDNGRRYIPAPRDRIGLVTAFMLSRRRPPESRALPTSRFTIFLDDGCVPAPRAEPTDLQHRISAAQWRTKDPKTRALTAGIRGLGPAIGSVRGLSRPQTTIDTSSVVDLSAPMCSRPSHERFFLSHVSLFPLADDATGNRLSQIRANPPLEKGMVQGGDSLNLR
ncbi:hypothetical protein THAOC_01201 [Thalassiosira oceanica]|uniref:Uncharacterized protein n=1 Tax=Thalassiosira oceanica TaxID=159749 RepID=K0TR13_THAOC|nr:hypothetical protein THAOC_01201 [Thalassiosira oceanica]|eukprot:EJK76997.1 hypothetical protein THAOC_01201 [Thalassiosira oceanica]